MFVLLVFPKLVSADAAEQVLSLPWHRWPSPLLFPEEKSRYWVKIPLPAGNLPISARKKPVQTRSLVSI